MITAEFLEAHGDPELAEFIKRIRDTRVVVAEAIEKPLHVETWDDKAEGPYTEDCAIDPNQPSANRSRT